jgi:hypothetical protein
MDTSNDIRQRWLEDARDPWRGRTAAKRGSEASSAEGVATVQS